MCFLQTLDQFEDSYHSLWFPHNIKASRNYFLTAYVHLFKNIKVFGLIITVNHFHCKQFWGKKHKKYKKKTKNHTWTYYSEITFVNILIYFLPIFFFLCVWKQQQQKKTRVAESLYLSPSTSATSWWIDIILCPYFSLKIISLSFL